MIVTREDIRNVAIIAHVDHGKTTLVDELLKQSGAFRQNQVIQERVMDSNDLERERGITILSKNTAVYYNQTKINIIDTPGHADFGGEVERVLKMVNGVILVVDAFEGPMPQTKFVLQNALALKLPVVVCINKVDRPDARPDEVVDEVLELFMDLEATDEQLNAPFVYASARTGIAYLPEGEAVEGQGMKALFDSILTYIPAPSGDPDAPMQTLISTIDYSEYLGRIGIGKVENGIIKVNDDAIIVNIHDPSVAKKVKISKLYEFDGLNRIEVAEAAFGSIVAISGATSGIEDIHIGDTLCDLSKPEPLPFNKISEPTMAVYFIVNDSPFAGREGKFVTSRHLRERLFRELNKDVSLRVEELEDEMSTFKVSGRGELHISILIETMRREGYEFQVSKPEVLFCEINNQRHEPIETVTIDVPEEFVGAVIEKLGKRKGELIGMSPVGSLSRLIFSIPSRGLMGYRTEFLTDTRGNGTMNAIFDCFAPYKGEMPSRQQGSLVAFETGESTTYGLYNAQERGELFINPGENVYAGMVVGRNARNGDLEINVCKKKQLTNTRSSGADDALRLTTATILSLEQSMEFITEDELVEITPDNLRIRKKILDATVRKRTMSAR